PVRYRADERPGIGVLADVDFPVAQPGELQTQQQVQAEHAIRPPVDDHLVLLVAHCGVSPLLVSTIRIRPSESDGGWPRAIGRSGRIALALSGCVLVARWRLRCVPERQ